MLKSIEVLELPDLPVLPTVIDTNTYASLMAAVEPVVKATAKDKAILPELVCSKIPAHDATKLAVAIGIAQDPGESFTESIITSKRRAEYLRKFFPDQSDAYYQDLYVLAPPGTEKTFTNQFGRSIGSLREEYDLKTSPTLSIDFKISEEANTQEMINVCIGIVTKERQPAQNKIREVLLYLQNQITTAERENPKRLVRTWRSVFAAYCALMSYAKVPFLLRAILASQIKAHRVLSKGFVDNVDAYERAHKALSYTSGKANPPAEMNDLLIQSVKAQIEADRHGVGKLKGRLVVEGKDPNEITHNERRSIISMFHTVPELAVYFAELFTGPSPISVGNAAQRWNEYITDEELDSPENINIRASRIRLFCELVLPTTASLNNPQLADRVLLFLSKTDAHEELFHRSDLWIEVMGNLQSQQKPTDTIEEHTEMIAKHLQTTYAIFQKIEPRFLKNKLKKYLIRQAYEHAKTACEGILLLAKDRIATEFDEASVIGNLRDHAAIPLLSPTTVNLSNVQIADKAQAALDTVAITLSPHPERPKDHGFWTAVTSATAILDSGVTFNSITLFFEDYKLAKIKVGIQGREPVVFTEADQKILHQFGLQATHQRFSKTKLEATTQNKPFEDLAKLTPDEEGIAAAAERNTLIFPEIATKLTPAGALFPLAIKLAMQADPKQTFTTLILHSPFWKEYCERYYPNDVSSLIDDEDQPLPGEQKKFHDPFGQGEVILDANLKLKKRQNFSVNDQIAEEDLQQTEFINTCFAIARSNQSVPSKVQKITLYLIAQLTTTPANRDAPATVWRNIFKTIGNLLSYPDFSPAFRSGLAQKLKVHQTFQRALDTYIEAQHRTGIALTYACREQTASPEIKEQVVLAIKHQIKTDKRHIGIINVRPDDAPENEEEQYYHQEKALIMGVCDDMPELVDYFVSLFRGNSPLSVGNAAQHLKGYIDGDRNPEKTRQLMLANVDEVTKSIFSTPEDLRIAGTTVPNDPEQAEARKARFETVCDKLLPTLADYNNPDLVERVLIFLSSYGVIIPLLSRADIWLAMPRELGDKTGSDVDAVINYLQATYLIFRNIDRDTIAHSIRMSISEISRSPKSAILIEQAIDAIPVDLDTNQLIEDLRVHTSIPLLGTQTIQVASGPNRPKGVEEMFSVEIQCHPTRPQDRSSWVLFRGLTAVTADGLAFRGLHLVFEDYKLVYGYGVREASGRAEFTAEEHQKLEQFGLLVAHQFYVRQANTTGNEDVTTSTSQPPEAPQPDEKTAEAVTYVASTREQGDLRNDVREVSQRVLDRSRREMNEAIKGNDQFLWQLMSGTATADTMEAVMLFHYDAATDTYSRLKANAVGQLYLDGVFSSVDKMAAEGLYLLSKTPHMKSLGFSLRRQRDTKGKTFWNMKAEVSSAHASANYDRHKLNGLQDLGALETVQTDQILIANDISNVPELQREEITVGSKDSTERTRVKENIVPRRTATYLPHGPITTVRYEPPTPITKGNDKVDTSSAAVESIHHPGMISKATFATPGQITTLIRPSRTYQTKIGVMGKTTADDKKDFTTAAEDLARDSWFSHYAAEQLAAVTDELRDVANLVLPDTARKQTVELLLHAVSGAEVVDDVTAYEQKLKEYCEELKQVGISEKLKTALLEQAIGWSNDHLQNVMLDLLAAIPDGEEKPKTLAEKRTHSALEAIAAEITNYQKRSDRALERYKQGLSYPLAQLARIGLSDQEKETIGLLVIAIGQKIKNPVLANNQAIVAEVASKIRDIPGREELLKQKGLLEADLLLKREELAKNLDSIARKTTLAVTAEHDPEFVLTTVFTLLEELNNDNYNTSALRILSALKWLANIGLDQERKTRLDEEILTIMDHQELDEAQREKLYTHCESIVLSIPSIKPDQPIYDLPPQEMQISIPSVHVVNPVVTRTTFSRGSYTKLSDAVPRLKTQMGKTA